MKGHFIAVVSKIKFSCRSAWFFAKIKDPRVVSVRRRSFRPTVGVALARMEVGSEVASSRVPPDPDPPDPNLNTTHLRSQSSSSTWLTLSVLWWPNKGQKSHLVGRCITKGHKLIYKNIFLNKKSLQVSETVMFMWNKMIHSPIPDNIFLVLWVKMLSRSLRQWGMKWTKLSSIYENEENASKRMSCKNFSLDCKNFTTSVRNTHPNLSHRSTLDISSCPNKCVPLPPFSLTFE